MDKFLKLAEYLFEDSLDPVTFSSLDGSYIYANNAACKLLGYSHKELLKLHIYDIDQKVNLENFKKIVAEKIKAGALIIDTSLKCKNGKFLPVQKVVKYLQHNDVSFFYTVIRDVSEKLSLEAKLQTSKETIDLVGKGSAVGFWDYYSDTDECFYTKEYKKIIGINPRASDKEAREYWKKHILKSDKKLIEQIFAKRGKGKKNFYVGYRIKDKKGNIKWINSSGAMKYDENGKAVRAAGSIIDVTNLKKQIEENKALSKELEKFNFFIEKAPYPTFIVNRKEKIFFANNAAHKKFGFHKTKKPLINRSIEKIKLLSAGKTWKEIVQKIHKKKVFKFETNFVDQKTKADSIAEILTHKIKYLGEYCICLFVLDITERKQIEMKLKNSEERFRLAVTASREGVWESKVGQDEEYWSPQYLRLLGYKKGEVKPSFSAFINNIHPDDVNRVKKGWFDYLRNKTSYEFEFRYRVKSGEYKWFLTRGYAEWDKDGKPIRGVGIMRNIHNRKLREQQILNYAKKLQQTNQDLEEFAYIASHDLRQPLQGISYYSTFLTEDYSDKLDAKGKAMLARLKEQADYMEKLIQDLLTYARTAKTAKFLPANMNKIVNEVINSMDVFLKEKNAEIIIKDELPEMLCNNEIIAELFRNLIVNGVIYNLSKDKIITIRYNNTRSHHKFSIKDNGIGIKAEYYKTVFEPFKGIYFKEQFEEGTGLGLTLVKKIIDLHNGKIWIKSKVDKGTVFYFTIPKSYTVA